MAAGKILWNSVPTKSYKLIIIISRLTEFELTTSTNYFPITEPQKSQFADILYEIC